MNLLLLRGFVRDQSCWEGFGSQLESAIPGLKVFCLDLPGIGTESRQVSPTTIEKIALDVRTKWKKLKEQHPGDWGIFAVSLGGMVGLHWLSNEDDFKFGIIVNSSASNLSGPTLRFQPHNIPLALRAAWTSDPWKREAIILKITSVSKDQHAALIERRKRRTIAPISLQNFLNTGIRQIRAVSTFKLLKKPKVPVEIVLSRADGLANPACSRALAGFLGVKPVEHEWGGHDLVLDDAPWVIAKTKSFIQSVGVA